MNIALWIVAGLLAVVFLGSGVTKLAQPKEKLVASSTGAALDGYGAGAIKAIGTLEVLAAAGLILPAALTTATVLVPLAALGTALLMVGAALTHLHRHEPQAITVNIVLLAMAVFVAWGRFAAQPFTT
ncbi:DoxX family protein [Actinophytocola gossypii]|uniref:DoxX family protein n=1 Tax=Actinophytocola gossypii TaxID=2812003 RepID=A0ABT2J2W6_9PSEU|nr:DoxX family protein [Actinophytocola gossypii]MCT2582186.1 DoxX family protein [Actinophytocola gossypii]